MQTKKILKNPATAEVAVVAASLGMIASMAAGSPTSFAAFSAAWIAGMAYWAVATIAQGKKEKALKELENDDI